MGVGVGVTVGVCVTVGADDTVGVLALEGALTGLEWVMTRLAGCDARAGALAAAWVCCGRDA